MYCCSTTRYMRWPTSFHTTDHSTTPTSYPCTQPTNQPTNKLYNNKTHFIWSNKQINFYCDGGGQLLLLEHAIDRFIELDEIRLRTQPSNSSSSSFLVHIVLKLFSISLGIIINYYCSYMNVYLLANVCLHVCMFVYNTTGPVYNYIFPMCSV